jgi:hypothetical protein
MRRASPVRSSRSGLFANLSVVCALCCKHHVHNKLLREQAQLRQLRVTLVGGCCGVCPLKRVVAVVCVL